MVSTKVWISLRLKSFLPSFNTTNGLANRFSIICDWEAIFSVESGKLGKMNVLLLHDSLGCWQRRSQLLIQIPSPVLCLSQQLDTMIASPGQAETTTANARKKKNCDCEIWVYQINIQTAFSVSKYFHTFPVVSWGDIFELIPAYLQSATPQVIWE